MKTIFAGDGLESRHRFYSDPGQVLVQPNTVQWKLVCQTGKVLQDWTTAEIVVIASDQGELLDAYADVVIDGPLNVMQTTGTRETKRLLISADRGTARQASGEVEYAVKKLD